MTHTPSRFYPKSLSLVVEHMLSLLVVFLLLMAAALSTGQLFGLHLGLKESEARTSAVPIAEQPDDRCLQQLGIDASQLQMNPRDSASWTLIRTDGTVAGTVIATAPYATDVQGFAGPTPLYIYIGVEGQVKSIAAADNADTPSFFDTAFYTLSTAWNGLSVHQAATHKVDAVTGATYSSQGIIGNVQRALAAADSAEGTATPSPTIGWMRTAAVAVVLLLGIVASWKLRGRKWLRIVQLLLNVGVLGFWCGQFLSLSLFRGWISGGLNPVAWLPTLLVLAVAVLMPFFRRKHHYCTWVCPYGSLQELAALLPLPRIHCSARVYRIMGRIRFYAFCLLMFLLWTGLGAEVLDYEPFSAFLVTTAPTIVLILAGTMVVASCFVPRLWCRCLCPMGVLLDLSEDTQIPTTVHRGAGESRTSTR